MSVLELYRCEYNTKKRIQSIDESKMFHISEYSVYILYSVDVPAISYINQSIVYTRV